MGCPGRKTLSFFLIFVLIYLHGALSQEAGPTGQRKPFFERLRRLEEQFRRFQEATLTHLQAIASNYNLSYNIDARFQNLAQESQALALEVNQSQAAVQGDLGHLKTWIQKTQRRSRKFATWGLHSSSRTPPPRMSSSSAEASSQACGPCLSAAGSGQPQATWAPSSPMPPRRTTTSWCCMAGTPWPPAPSTL
ncbi:pentraxin 4 [Phyllostomus discolor]|uniref:Pentraxin 4 n=1 Tax=Phyllostomus discolor TaxID=89673 RepID=A0A834EMS0_9CHIR|nr:pentraxin 4 [Phyllostomus discolor]